jgi:putative heme-binding domain-containing protein
VALNDGKVLDRLLDQLGKTDDPPLHRDVLRGVQEGLSGRRDFPMPAAWRDAYPLLVASPLPEVRERGLSLAVLFGDARALTTLREVALDRKAPAAFRQHAVQTLVFKRARDVVPLLQGLLDDPAVRVPSVRGLAGFDDTRTPALLLKRYPTWTDDERADAVATLTSRPAYALALLDAVAADQVPRRDVTAFTVRQLLALNNAAITERVQEVWGSIRPASQEKLAAMARLKAALTPDALKKANLQSGRALYAKHCGACHRLFDEGGTVGPELTGSQRTNLDYVLENVLDPSAIVPREYQVTVFATTSGRVLTGILKKETEQAVTVQTQNELLVLPKEDLESRTPSPLSMMPEGILTPLRPEEVRDLIGYLASPVQVPLAAKR